MERVKEQKGYPCQKKGENNIATLGGHKLEGAIKEARGFEATLYLESRHRAQGIYKSMLNKSIFLNIFRDLCLQIKLLFT